MVKCVATARFAAHTPRMATAASFAELVDEGASVPVDGWDFSWFDGRATEERPPWGYARMLADRIGVAGAVLDIQTGGGEVFAEVLRDAAHRPALAVATESWLPNVDVARHRLAPLGARVIQVAEDAGLPFVAATFDLVSSRHPTALNWSEIARVLAPGGILLCQHIGEDSVRELTEFMMGPQPPGDGSWRPERIAAEAAAAGLQVVDLRHAALRMTFGDIGAVVHFLRKVIWIVPDFTVSAYQDRLRELHERIQTEGPFVAHAQRVLIEARQPM
jgi:SAM-dependent methyltransferase